MIGEELIVLIGSYSSGVCAGDDSLSELNSRLNYKAVLRPLAQGSPPLHSKLLLSATGQLNHL